MVVLLWLYFSRGTAKMSILKIFQSEMHEEEKVT